MTIRRTLPECSCPGPEGVEQAALSVIVERYSGVDWILTGRSEPVRPHEAVRLVARGASGTVRFQVWSPHGPELGEHGVEVRAGLGGLAYLTYTTGPENGVYAVRVDARAGAIPILGSISRQLAGTTFTVSSSAEAPAKEPKEKSLLERSGIGLGGVLGDLKGVGLVALGIVALLVISKLIPQRSRHDENH